VILSFLKNRLNACLVLIASFALASVQGVEYPSWSSEELERFKGGYVFEESPLLTPLQGNIDGRLNVYESEGGLNKVVVSYDVIDEYYAQLMNDYLVDPQLLLTRNHGADVAAYLAYHAELSEIDLRLFLFNRDQSLPSVHDFEETLRERFSESALTGCVIYYLSDASRSKLIMVGEGAESVPSMSVDENRAKIKALEKSHAPLQLEAFLSQVSISLFWLEQSRRSSSKGEGAVAILGEATRVESNGTKFQELVKIIGPYLISASAVILACVAMGIVYYRWNKKRVYEFPLLVIPKRLGADYAAGVGAVMAFQSDRVSPSNQREKEVDFFSEI